MKNLIFLSLDILMAVQAKIVEGGLSAITSCQTERVKEDKSQGVWPPGKFLETHLLILGKSFIVKVGIPEKVVDKVIYVYVRTFNRTSASS